jgi:hypothetical protein
MWKRSFTWFGLVPAFCAIASFSAVRLIRSHEPRIEIVTTVDLGLQEQGRPVAARIPIRNTGGAPLIIEHLRASCSCIGLLWNAQKLESVQILPGSERELTVELNIPASSQQSFHAMVEFETNDPGRPRVHTDILAQVDGRIIAIPTAVQLGRLSPLQRARRTIEIRNTGRGAACAIEKVVSSAPDRLVVHSLTKSTERSDGKTESLGARIGLIDVEFVAPTHPVVFEETVSVLEEGNDQPILQIPVHARVATQVQVAPSTLVLPIMSTEGPVFVATVICSASPDKQLDVQIVASPAHCVAKLETEASTPARKAVIIDAAARAGTTSEVPSHEELRLRCAVSGREEIVTIPITFRPHKTKPTASSEGAP